MHFPVVIVLQMYVFLQSIFTIENVFLIRKNPRNHMVSVFSCNFWICQSVSVRFGEVKTL